MNIIFLITKIYYFMHLQFKFEVWKKFNKTKKLTKYKKIQNYSKFEHRILNNVERLNKNNKAKKLKK
jgi:hypothetical protein